MVSGALTLCLSSAVLAQSVTCGAGSSAPYRQPATQPFALVAPSTPQTSPRAAAQQPPAPYVPPYGTPAIPTSLPIVSSPPPASLPPVALPPQLLSPAGKGGNMILPIPAKSATPSGQFSVSNGQIIGPDGKPFIAKGINVFPGQVDAATIQSTLPGVNSVRLAATPGTDPALIDQMVQGITSKGGVVLIEDHSSSGAAGGNNVLTGQTLANETAWYAGLAAKYKNNPGVWFGTANEPDNTSNLKSIADQERAIYDAIRGTGNTSMVALEMRGGFTNDFAQQNASTFADMKNVAWDTHVYGWISKYSTSDSAIFSAFGNQVASAQSVKSADGVVPTFVGEYGPSTTGLAAADANGTQTVQQVLQSNLGGFAWAWDAGTDNLTSNGNLTAFGQQVAGSFASGK